jgi:hypothetical protein
MQAKRQQHGHSANANAPVWFQWTFQETQIP